jgi:hypothetical protein
MSNSIHDEEVTEKLDLAINTEELNKEEMDFLVKNNPELNEENNTLEMSSVQGVNKNSSSLITQVETKKMKSKLLAEIEEKE